MIFLSIACGLFAHHVTALTGAPAITARSVPLNTAPGTFPGTDPRDAGRLAELLLRQLTLEEKIGQMIQADIASISPADLRRYKLGSILAGGNAAPEGNLKSTPQAWLALVTDYHLAALAAAGAASEHRPIPILFGIDAVHGHAKVLGATIFPHNVGLGAAHDADLIRRIGEATAAEVAATGVDWAFAPTVAVVRDVRWGRSYESYSESPELVASYAPAMVTGLQGAPGTPTFLAPGHTLTSVKHFVGDGGTLAGRDQGNTVIPEAELLRVHAAAYPAAIDAGALIVMASYNSWNGVKLHGNHHLLTEVLKGQMGFSGFVVGDWNAHEQLPGCTKWSCAAAINAGVDMLMAPDSWKELYENTLAQARSGEIAQARVDDAVRRILRVKAIAGLFNSKAPARDGTPGRFDELGSQAHRAIAREAVRKSLVLLKNSHQLLPLSPASRVLVAGAGADDLGMQCGGWTIDWQGNHNSNPDFPGATSIYAGIDAVVRQSGGSTRLSRGGHYNEKPDVAILVFGETPYAEFQGDLETLEYSPTDKSDLATLRRLREAGIPTVSVFLSGRPLWVNPEINASDAFLAAWLPGSEGAGVADVLFRAPDGSVAYDFTGRLAFSWPETAMPVTFDGADRPSGAAFANGFGLDYRTPSQAQAVNLPEDARIPSLYDAPRGSLFFAGHPTAPWSLFVADGGAEIHVTTSSQASPRDALNVTVEPLGATATWNGSRDAVLKITGRPADLRVLDRGSLLEMRYRVDSMPTAAVSLGMQCTDVHCGTPHGAMFDVTKTFRAAGAGRWGTLSIPVSCFTSMGAALGSVDAPFAVATSGRLGLTIAEIRVAPSQTRGAPPSCPSIAQAHTWHSSPHR